MASIRMVKHRKLIPCFLNDKEERELFQVSLLNEYLEESPECRDRLCFLDCGVTSHSDGGALNYLFFSWDSQYTNHKLYQTTLRQLQMQFGFSAFSSSAFLQGIPESLSGSPMLNVYEFVSDAPQSSVSQSLSGEVGILAPQLSLATHVERSGYDTRDTAIVELEHYLKTYAAKLFANSERYLSFRSKPLCRLVVFPMSVYREDGTETSTTFVAGVFIGFDDPHQPSLSEIHRTFGSFAYAAMGTPILAQKAEADGAESVRRLFAHQVSTFAGKVSDGWLVSADEAAGMSESSSSLAKIAPLPALYEAVGTVINLWSMAISPENIFPPEVRRKGKTDGIAYPPRTLHDLAEYAIYIASRSALISGCENLVLKDAECLEKAFDRIVDADNARASLILKQPPQIPRIDLDYFQYKGRFRLDRDQDSNRTCFLQLSGVVRILVILFENALFHSPNTELLVSYSFQDSPEKEITISVANQKTASENSSSSPKASHVGLRGYRRCIDEVTSLFLKDNSVWISEPRTDPMTYEIDVSICGLKWLKVK